MKPEAFMVAEVIAIFSGYEPRQLFKNYRL
jgi:hypothetical protein